MKKDLENILYSKYAEMFIEKDYPITHSTMAWGFSHGDGWFDLIDNLCESIQKHSKIKKEKDASYEDVVVHQVKSKWNSLRFYYSGGDEVISNLVNFAENLSNVICEHCGSKETPDERCSCRYS